ncbi:MAG: phospholipid carrier-dependent glycosyltransferase [Oscillospiraceae bacterium]|jgi:4-amino-4-deoxy-L-arabinose transferase-like glycosyltransferase|nr:phospholipid carrier-dependent glycosyltransferase [Oscillospiraceae bacterium]
MVVPRLLAGVAVVYVLFFFYMVYRLERVRPQTLEWVERRRKPAFELSRAGALASSDILPVLLITAAYAAATFLNLGNMVSPQSFHRFEQGDAPIVIELKEPAKIEKIFYFTGLHHGSGQRAYRLDFSADGAAWRSGIKLEWNSYLERYVEVAAEGLPQEYSRTFRWDALNLVADTMGDTRFLRISAVYVPLELGEMSIFVRDTANGGQRVLSAADLVYPENAAGLFDEPEAVPARYDVLNSTHFDEIYHARTAYEHLRGIYPYEKTHPPLGKLITAAGIALFGMTPFGWRFMPALFGVLMVPLLYILLKWMFGKTRVAVCGTLLFAFDFMHFVQTRISTIDVYAVFFILCMYLFMYRYITSGPDAPFWKAAPPLILAGLSFGIGAAAKWVCIYAGAGLLALFCVYLVRRARYYRRMERSFLPFFLGTLLVALFSFIIIPGVIYVACYIPYAAARTPLTLTGGLGDIPAFIRSVWEECFQNQSYMYHYHSGLEATHDYAARWYEWLFDWKPIMYYWNPIREAGTRGSLWAFTNPLVTWAGLGALAFCGYGLYKRRSHTALFILIGYLSQLLPWIPISRITFPYHYFPSMLFLCIALACLFDRIVERDPVRGTRQMVIFTVAATALFVLFYPSLTGTQVPEWYPKYLLRWLSHKNWLM